MKTMTSRERLTGIYAGTEVDRPAFRLWGFLPGMGLLHPDYAPVCEEAERVTDFIYDAGSAFSFWGGVYANENCTWSREKTVDPKWDIVKTVFHTTLGDLTQRELCSTCGEPGYIIEHAAKTAEQLIAIIDMPYKAYDFSPDGWFSSEKAAGDKGITMFGLPHPGYAVQQVTGSETLAVLAIEEHDAVDYAVRKLAERAEEHAKKAVMSGIKGVYGWCGPELLTPPLLRPCDFRDFCVKYDKMIFDVVKEAGAHVWVHCHGKTAELIDDFIYMGVDVLNPLEPPKNGDVDLAAVVKKYGKRIGFEGNVEIQAILEDEPEKLLEITRECVSAGKKSGRFILCPSAGFMEYTHPSKRYIDNLLLFLREGSRMLCE